MGYEETHELGRVAERKIAAWLMSREWVIFPVCEADADNRAPQVYQHGWQGSVPDFLCFRGVAHRWVEVKSKSHWTWHRLTRQWQTGIDANSLRHYMDVRERSGTPLYLFFYHDNNEPSDADVENGSPLVCPTGLYGAELSTLCKCIAHRSTASTAQGERRFPAPTPGMVYWNFSTLRPIATIEDVERAAVLFRDHPIFNARSFSHERNQPGSAL